MTSTKTIAERLKDYSTIIAFGTLVLGSISGGLLWIDTRYAHAQEIRGLQQQLKESHEATQAQISSNQRQTEALVKAIRTKSVTDKLFEYDFKIRANQATPLDYAQYERLQRELKELQ